MHGSPNEQDRRAVYEVRSSEIQWRRVQRDVIAGAALLVSAFMVEKGFALVAPIVLYFIAAAWRGHDKRIGSGTLYLRTHIEPELRVPSYEEELERDRSCNKKWTRSAVAARLYFPMLQVGTLAYGLWRYFTTVPHPALLTFGVVALALAQAGLVLYLVVTHEHTK